MNDVKLNGVVVIEPIVSDDNKKVMITIANNYIRGRKISKTNFIRCFSYNENVIRIINNNIHVGSKIIVGGHLQNSFIEVNVQKVYQLNFIIDDIEFIQLTDKKEKEISEDIFNPFKNIYSYQDLKEELNRIKFDL